MFQAELAAHINAAELWTSGGSALVTYDARGPVSVLVRFVRAHDRARRDWYMDQWYATWAKHVLRMRVVVELWIEVGVRGGRQ